VTENPPDAALWVRALEWKLKGKGIWTKDDWEALGHCMAVSGHPCLTFTDELLETYPDAKVILTVRDNVEIWHETVMGTIWSFVKLLILPDVSIWRKLWRKLLPRDPFARVTQLFHMNADGMYHQFPEQGKDLYLNHNDKIRRVVPKENLLEFNVKQGWEPLCEFLDVKKPTWECPRVNERSVFVEHQRAFVGGLNGIAAMNVAKWVVGCVGVSVGVWYLLKKR
jgi:Sulfotransferase domain